MVTRKVSSAEEEDFFCPIGTELMLRVESSQAQLKGSLVGIDRNNFLILKIPLTLEVRTLLTNNVSVKGIFLYEGTIFGFISKVLNKIIIPAPLFFISYPAAMERHELRKNLRIHCSIPAGIHQDRKIDYTGVITDLSADGCRVTISDNIRQLPAKVMINSLFELSCEMLGIPQDRAVRCFVKNINRHDKRMHLGLQFDKVDLDVLERIQSYADRVLGIIA